MFILFVFEQNRCLNFVKDLVTALNLRLIIKISIVHIDVNIIVNYIHAKIIPYAEFYYGPTMADYVVYADVILEKF